MLSITLGGFLRNCAKEGAADQLSASDEQENEPMQKIGCLALLPRRSGLIVPEIAGLNLTIRAAERREA